MRKALLKLLSNCLYPFDRHKRMIFRGKHDPTAVYTAKLRKRGVEIGCGTFVYEGTLVRNRHSRIGKFCSIGPDVHIGTGRHPLDALTTNSMVHKNCFLIDGEFSVDPENRVEFEQSLPVTIGNDVWIGMNSIIMDGLTVGDGAVIGAGAIVTRDVPPYAIVAGIPAKVIRYRFDEKTIERLLRSRWYDRDMDLIKKLPVGDVDLCLGILEQTEEVEK